MRIYEVQNRSELLPSLLEIWEDSVLATHTFLSENEMEEIKKYVPKAIKNVEVLTIAVGDDRKPVAFMGTGNRRLEMLFLSPSVRGKGLGKQLVEYGIKNHGIYIVAVNEENLQAVGFYEHIGFKTCKRSALDKQGNPHPLLYMKLD